MLRLALLLIALAGTAAVAATTDEASAASSGPLPATMAVAGSICGFVAVQTAFRLGRLARNREALQPRTPAESCLVAGWRVSTGLLAFLVKAGLGVGLWAAVFDFSRDVLR